MKKNILVVLSLVMILMTACSQNDEIMNEVNSCTLAQVEGEYEAFLNESGMTYEQYFKGYSLDEVTAPKDEKTPTNTLETDADDELMKLIQDYLESSYSKKQVRIKPVTEYLPYMGVLKARTCGNYPELQLFMDNEDGGDWARVEGLNGHNVIEKELPYTYVDGNRNIWMSFCLVMNDQNVMVPQGFGALYFPGGNAALIAENAKKLVPEKNAIKPDYSENYSSLTFLERFHDNEDNNNKNEAKYSGFSTGSSWNPLGDIYPTYTPRPTYVGEKNTLLTWMFPNREPLNTFHPGFAYGVLAYQDLPAAAIHIDDENGKNTNSISKVEWSPTENAYRRTQLNKYGTYNGIQASENTVYKVTIIM